MSRPVKSVPLSPFQKRHLPYLQNISGPGFPRSPLIMRACISALLSQIGRLKPGLMRQSRLYLKIIRAHEDRIHDIPNFTRGQRDKRLGDFLAYNDKRVQDALKYLANGSLLPGNHFPETLRIQHQLLLEFLDVNAFPPIEQNAELMKRLTREWLDEYAAQLIEVHKTLTTLPCLCRYETSIPTKGMEKLSRALLIETLLGNLHNTTQKQVHKLRKSPQRPHVISNSQTLK